MKIPSLRLLLLTLSIPLIVLLGCEEPGIEEIDQSSSEIPDHIRPALLEKSSYEWSHAEKIIGFRNIDQIWNTRLIEAGDEPYPLPRDETPDLLQVKFEYNDSTYGLEEFIDHHRILGLLVIKDDMVVLERYSQGNTPKSKWISYSVAKSVVSMLIGAAVQDGFISSLDDPITNYLPELEGSEYEKVSIRHAMQMASGVKWNEEYNDPESDIRKYISIKETSGMLDYLEKLPRVAPPGERFNYNSAETQLVGLVLRAAIGKNLSSYLSSKIWKPFGMESDANWLLLNPDGPEDGGCCISATLRDYGRIGLFAISEHKNKPANQAVLPEDWMEETTTPSPAANQYGALWWLYHIDSTRTYAAYGIFGQMIWIDPIENLVIVTHSAWPEALGQGEDNFYGYNAAFAAAVTELLKE